MPASQGVSAVLWGEENTGQLYNNLQLRCDNDNNDNYLLSVNIAPGTIL